MTRDSVSILDALVSMKSQPSRIMAMGVGGAGGNAIEHMWQMQVEGVNLAACNTDQNDLDKLHIAEENRILLGGDGLGAGNTAERGAECAKMSIDKVRDLFNARGTEMLFLAAGMGAGTGTGATPVIAELARDMKILTVAIVTTPPKNEGPLRVNQANAGIEKLRKHVDAMIILSNDAINELYGHLPAVAGFGRANDVIAFAAKGLAEIITHKSNLVHVDFADVCTVMRNSGSAVMGVATESGEGRAERIVDNILNSPLFGDVSISGSRNVLINISVSSSEGLTLNEAHQVRDRVQHYAKSVDEKGNVRYTNIIWGMSIKPNLSEDEMEVVIVATGFENDSLGRPVVITADEAKVPVVPPTIPTHEVPGEKKPITPQQPAAPVSRPAPSPIPRPSRNFIEIEECKRTPAYIKHGITLSVSAKAKSIGGVESEPEQEGAQMQALF